MFTATLYQDCYSTPSMRNLWSSESSIYYWLEVEKQLAKCQAEMGLIPVEAANQITAIDVSQIDVDAMTESMHLVGRPIVGLVQQMRRLVGEDQARFVHYKSTTQDIMDTAMMLQMQRAFELLQISLAEACDKLSNLLSKHRDQRIMARTNGQAAKPMRLNTKFNVWLQELERRQQSLSRAVSQCQLQLGGAVGDLQDYQESEGDQLRQALAIKLGLSIVDPHWQNARDILAEQLGSLAVLNTSIGKIAHNVNLLSSSDIGELEERYVNGQGASSAMSHKKNQRSSEFGEAVATLGRQRSEQINSLTMHHHERSGGQWIAEWALVPEAFCFTSGACYWLERMFSLMTVNTDVMDANIDFYLQKIA